MHKKFEKNRRKIKGGCQSGRKVVTHNSKNDLPLGTQIELFAKSFISAFHEILIGSYKIESDPILQDINVRII